MPIRIKPDHDLGPCVLTLKSLEGITDILERDFTNVKYSASDDIWEIYDEPRDSFLEAISTHETLDSFEIHAKADSPNRQITMVFNDEEASVRCEADPDQEHWFEHFLIDLKKYVLRASFVQLAAFAYKQRRFYLSIPFLLIPINPAISISTPYCRIIIHKKPPNPFLENIKANLVSSLIWFLLGALLLLVTQWVLKEFGVDLNPFD